ncbi:alpha beta hydrolase fold-3 domain-containing protein [Cercophora scortea]|uniref:Alpha beta hydrolase fold-3 domain-containing protein n=1 Tax=Cercophora scortea TaxID=314031 RepID=A0AAE0M2Y5_9PEZI|nr:alpha beta hydrolase fold-3 domain-containing protein [Cercophora scortea]
MAATRQYDNEGSHGDIINPLHTSVVDKLDPDYVAIYMKYQARAPRADQVPYHVYNADRAKYNFPGHLVSGASPAVGTTKTYKVPVSDPAGEISVRVYTPIAKSATNGNLDRDGLLPVLIDYHGGGFVIGNLESDDFFCRQVCEAIGCVVVNVDYRMAPEFPHPVPATDAYAALKWVVANAEMLRVDVARVAVSGFSAGANLAAVVAIMARDDNSIEMAGVKLVLQVLVVPVIDARYVPFDHGELPQVNRDGVVPYESYVSCEFAPVLPLSRLVWFYRLWLGAEREVWRRNAEDWRASPIVADNHGGLPPASILVAEVDPLRSEGVAYHEKLLAAGTRSEIKMYTGCGHTFSHWGGQLIKGQECVDDAVAALRDAFGSVLG